MSNFKTKLSKLLEEHNGDPDAVFHALGLPVPEESEDEEEYDDESNTQAFEGFPDQQFLDDIPEIPELIDTEAEFNLDLFLAASSPSTSDGPVTTSVSTTPPVVASVSRMVTPPVAASISGMVTPPAVIGVAGPSTARARTVTPPAADGVGGPSNQHACGDPNLLPRKRKFFWTQRQTPVTRRLNHQQTTEYFSKEKIKKLKWRPGTLQIKDDDVKFSGTGNYPSEIMELDTPLQFFCFLFTNDLVDHITDETNLYARQTNPNTRFLATREKLLQFFGTCLLTGIIHMPNIRNYWKPSIGIEVIRKCMSVNSFEEIRRFLHFNDNTNYDPTDKDRDRLYKLRPLIDGLLSRFQLLPADEKLSLDEQMCSTKARSYLKQYMRNKPHKWGYKLFVLSATDGYVYNFEIYTGQPTTPLPKEPDLGATGNTVVRLCRHLQETGHKLYYDNFYTSIPLACYLSKEKGIQTLGTLNRSRIPNIPFTNQKKMEKNPRGYYEEFVSAGKGVLLCILSWLDNRVVNFLSTFVGGSPEGKIKRFDKKKMEKVDVRCPSIVKVYNAHMGGVDLVDSHIGRYKIILKSRKWYLRLFYHFLDVTIINAWLLYRRVKTRRNEPAKLTLAQFREEVGIALCSVAMKSPSRGRRPATQLQDVIAKKYCPSTNLPPKDTRLDSVDHWPVLGSRNRCRYPSCKGKSSVKCEKCDVYLCIQSKRNCFYVFHRQ